ncbi:MAG: protein translocase subunit SecD [Crocinitomicaceae bacterium]|nr:protein translocase subunit SecD [Crocinitomicaceae bacterium]
MRNKGFFWFLTILLTAICIYQLSFTWVSNSVENKAGKKAEAEAARIIEETEADADGTRTYTLNNGVVVDLNKGDAKELIKAALINDDLLGQAEKEVYPVFGSTFKEVKKRSLAFGLDLVGGMSITLEVSVPDLVKNYARNENQPQFRRAWDAANEFYTENGGDFIDLFMEQHAKLNPGKQAVRFFAFSEIDELDMNSTDADVKAFLEGIETTSMGGVKEIMERRINQFGVAQPNIQEDKTNNRLYIELPGVQDEVTVKENLVSTANLEFFETYTLQQIAEGWTAAMELSKDDEVVLEDTPVVVDSTEIDTTLNDTTSISADEDLFDEDEELDFLSDSTEELTGLASYMALMIGDSRIGLVLPENRGKVNALLNRKDIKAVFNSDVKFMWSAEMETMGETKETGYILYAIKVPLDGKARVGGKDIASANRDYNQDEGSVVVNVRMTEEGSDKWAQMTEANKGKVVAITLDDVVYSAPRVNGVISGGNTEISGSFSIQEADNLSGLLNGGALPTKLVLKEFNKVGPTIGADNSKSSLLSFGIALLLVFVYMIFYYGKAGIVADIALFANILFIFGALGSFGAVLTLAGMAGIVLTIGMAVDANVLIFERIREEQAAGKDLKAAVDTGFKRALSSIIDANVTTMLTAIVLKSFGSGPIESFATTLIIGIFTSVFAALVITRLCINWWMKKGKNITFESKMTKGAFKKLNFNFVGKRKMYYMISGVLIIGGIIAIVARGLNPSVEFSGGRTFGIEFDKSASSEQDLVKNELLKQFGDGVSVETKTKGSSFFLEVTTNYLREDESTDGDKLVKEKLEAGLDECKSKLGGYSIEESRSVSPTVSKELVVSSAWAIGLSLLIIFAYILIRFGRWQYSIGAILAMVHDVVLVLAAFSIFHGILPFNMDVDQAFIAAILTVIGYSINDTVIVFDRIRENLRTFKGTDEQENINRSLNSTLSRTFNTSITTFIVLLIIFIFGGTAIQGFVFALMIGVIVGTYSSVCIATPVLIDLSKKVKKEAE